MGKGLRGGSIKLQKTLAGNSLQTHEMGSNSNYQAIAKWYCREFIKTWWW